MHDEGPRAHAGLASAGTYSRGVLQVVLCREAVLPHGAWHALQSIGKACSRIRLRLHWCTCSQEAAPPGTCGST